MKKTLVTAMSLALATAAFAQGTIVFNNNLAGTIASRVYSPTPGNEGVQKVGNTAAQLPAGTQTYTGALIAGSGWTAQLWAAPGSVIPAGVANPYGVIDSSLLAATPTTTFRTGSAAGVLVATTATTANNVAPDLAAAVVQMRVFPTSFGTWAAAVAAFEASNPLAILGASPMFVLNAVGGSANTPAVMLGLQSFSLVAQVPEPGTLALAGLGAAALLLFRRKQ